MAKEICQNPEVCPDDQPCNNKTELEENAVTRRFRILGVSGSQLRAK